MLQYAGWYGASNQIIYVKDNNIYTKAADSAISERITTDGSTTTLNGITNPLYRGMSVIKKECAYNKKEVLIVILLQV